MTPTAKVILALALSVLSGWAAHVMALRLQVARAEPISSPNRASSQPSLSKPSLVPDGKLPTRRELAACTTDSLWDWLLQTKGDIEIREAVAEELLDRQGKAAVQAAFAVEDPSLRAEAGELLMDALAARDPWSAFEFFRAYSQEFAPHWGISTVTAALVAAGAMSSEKVMAVIEAGSGSDETRLKDLKYAPGFDFGAVMDQIASYSKTPGQQPRAIPANLLESWAASSPGAAMSWLREHSGMSDVACTWQFRGADFLSAVARSPSPERSEALNLLKQQPQKDVQEAWGRIITDNHGAIDPAFLSAASEMQTRDSYLLESLLASRTATTFPASAWSAVPAGEREAVLASALDRWTAQDPTSIGAEARARWERSVRSAWAEPKGE